MLKKLVQATALLAVCALVFAGCSDDGGDETAEDETEETTGPTTTLAPLPAEYGDDAEFDAMYDACEAGDFAQCDALFQGSEPRSALSQFGSTCGELFPIDQEPVSCEEMVTDEGTPVDNYGENEELDGYWDDCEGGDPDACDLLYNLSPWETTYEEYGASCGERREPLIGDEWASCIDSM